jgi:hypothetical protein
VCAPPPANYLEAETIITATTGAGVTTATTFTDGMYLPSGTFLPLNQFHFHSPSEHTINGMHYPLELHMVHKLFFNATTGVRVPATATGGQPAGTNMTAAVIGIMFGYRCARTHARRAHAQPRVRAPYMRVLTHSRARVAARTARTARS